MNEPRHLLVRVLPALGLELFVWLPVGALIDAATTATLGEDFSVSQRLAEFLPLLRGVGVGAAFAFVIDDLYTPNSWLKSTWSNLRRPADIAIERSGGRSEHRISACIKFRANARSALVTVRSAQLVHTLSGVEWRWLSKPITVASTQPRSRGEELTVLVFERQGDAGMFVPGELAETVAINEHKIIGAQIVVNVGGRIEERIVEFEVSPALPLTRVLGTESKLPHLNAKSAASPERS